MPSRSNVPRTISRATHIPRYYSHPSALVTAPLSVHPQKGHYVVVRCSSRSEADRWRRALESHLVEDFASQYVHPHPMSTNPSLFRDTLIIDIGSCSVRAGILSSQATLPQLFFPSVVATDRESRRQVWGQDALAPETRISGSLSFPMKPSHRISKVRRNAIIKNTPIVPCRAVSKISYAFVCCNK